MPLQEIKLPELGENIHSAQVIKILVTTGSLIKKEQPILELETEKSVFEIPSPVNGKVKTIHVKEGEKIKVKQTLLIIETNEKSVEEENSSESIEFSPQVSKKKSDRLIAGEKKSKSFLKNRKSENVFTSPTVRKIAREMKINLSEVSGTGPNGRILTEDLIESAKKDRSHSNSFLPSVLPDFSKWGPIERKAMSNVRLKTAEHVLRSWSLIPHVTQFDEVEIEKLEEFRKKFSEFTEEKGGKLTLTAILIFLVASTLKEYPQLNASVDLEKEEIIYKHYCHIAIAVDTDRGLLAPVIRNADQKNILQLSIELKEISEKARNRKLKPEEMQGGTFTITNLGGITGTHFTPIIQWPEVAILGIGRLKSTPVFVNEKISIQKILPLSLSYDHRLIDGADAARFLKSISHRIQQPLSIE